MKRYVGGRKRIIIPGGDQYVSLVAKKKRNVTPSQVATDHAIATGMYNSARTISLRLNQVWLYARKHVQYIPLQPRYCRVRLR